MALVVEDGTGLSNAQCYRGATATAAYHTARGDSTFAALSDAAKEAAILKAQEFMRDEYGGGLLGYKVLSTQALDFPRYGIEKQGYEGVVYWPSDTIPTIIADVESDLALKSLAGALVSDLTQAKKSVKVGSLAVEYDTTANRQTFYAAIHSKISQFLSGGGSGMAEIIRT